MWFTFITARLFISVSFQPRLAATLLTSCSVVNSPTQRVGLSPTFRSASLAQHSCNSCPASVRAAGFYYAKCLDPVFRDETIDRFINNLWQAELMTESKGYLLL